MTAPSPADDHRTVGARFAEVVEGVTDWDAPTPVPEWRARDVVGHLTTWFPGFLASGTSVALPPGPSAADDPVAAWRHQYDAVQVLLDDPATAGLTLTNPHLGELPLPGAVAQFYTADVFLHTWDLARASGQAPGLDEDRCAATLAGMEPLDEMLRASGQYGARRPVADDAPASDRLAAFIGRDPQWRPPAGGTS